MFINEGDEIDKIYLPAHSNHRHNVHKQLCCICTRCYQGVTRSGATRSLSRTGGGIYFRDGGYHITILKIEIFYFVFLTKSYKNVSKFLYIFWGFQNIFSSKKISWCTKVFSAPLSGFATTNVIFWGK